MNKLFVNPFALAKPLTEPCFFDCRSSMCRRPFQGDQYLEDVGPSKHCPQLNQPQIFRQLISVDP